MNQHYFFQYANFDFYNSLEPTCCGELEHLDLLVFKPSTSDVKASQIVRVPSMEERGENPTQKDTLKHDIVTGMGSLSLALSLGKVLFVYYMFRFMYIQNL